jgi:anti-anti-sigma regulatory factor
VIRLEGAIDIAAAAEFKKLLLQACGSGKEVRLALDGANDLDVTAVELIWAARRAAEGAGVTFALSGALPESVLSALGYAGLKQFLVPLDAS